MNVRPWRWLAAALGGSVIALAVVLGLLRLVLDRTPEYASQVAEWIRDETGLRLSFARVDARLRWFGPEIVLHDALVLDRRDASPLFAVREGSIGLDLLQWVRSGELVAGRVRFLEPEVAIERLPDGRFRLVGLRERRPDAPPFDLDRLPAGRLEVRGARLEYRDLKTGRGPWRLEGVDLDLRRDDEGLEAKGSGALPEALGRRLEFELSLVGDLGVPRALAGRLEARVGGARLAGLAQIEPRLDGRVLDGGGDLRLIANVADGRLERGRVELELADLRLALPSRAPPSVEAVEISAPRPAPGGNPLALPSVEQRFVQRPQAALPTRLDYAALRGTLRYRREGERHVLQVEGLELAPAQGGDAFAPLDLQLEFAGDPRTRFELSARSAPLRLEQLWPLALVAPVPALEPWLGLDPRGRLEALEIKVRRDRAGAPPTFSGTLRLRDLATRAVGRQPGLAGLSVDAEGDDRAGRFTLRLQAASLDWPRQFRAPITLQSATASGAWRREGKGWRLSSEDVLIEDPRAAARGRLALYLEPGAFSPLLEAQATVSRGDARVVREVLPLGRLKPTTLAWFESAALSGQVVSGTLDYRGPVRRFPFRNGEGEFSARATVRDASLNYFTGFTPVQVQEATLEFRNASLRVRSDSARIGALAVSEAEYHMADYRDPVIEVRGRARGDLTDALAYLQRSPLGPRLGAQFMALRASGAADYRVALSMPTGKPEARRYRVDVAMPSATLRSPLLRAPLEKVSGTLRIEDDTARGENLKGVYLDGPVTIGVQPATPGAGADRALLVRARGSAAGARGLPLLGLPAGISASGFADYRLEARIERERGGQAWRAAVDAESDLAGLAIDAPAPFGKPAGEARPTRVESRTRGATRNELRVQSGQGRAALAFVERGGEWQLERGQVRFDGGAVALPERPGIAVAGRWPEVDLAEWLTLGGDARAGKGRGIADWLGPLDVQVERLQLLGFEFRDVSARAEAGRDAWRVDVQGPDAVGRVLVPFELEGERPLVVNLERVALHAPRAVAPVAAGAAAESSDPRRAPAVLLRAEELQWEQRRFGRVEADLRRVPGGLEFARLRSESPAFTIEGSGSWLAQATGASETRLALRFTSKDFAAASRALGYRDAVEAERAQLAAELRWPGGLDGRVLERATGTVGIELDRGQVRDIEPGAGRVLGLLSVVELPRRLALDFRDVTGEGLAFDTVRGDFQLREGSAFTENLLLKGAAVNVGLAGRTGLVAEDYDQVLVVSGNPSGALTVAGTLAGGPVIGAGVLVLSQLFKGQLEGLARVYYRVGGSWAKPLVERIAAPPAPEAAPEAAAAAPVVTAEPGND